MRHAEPLAITLEWPPFQAFPLATEEYRKGMNDSRYVPIHMLVSNTVTLVAPSSLGMAWQVPSWKSRNYMPSPPHDPL